MRPESEQNFDTTETEDTIESIEKKIAKTGYPDISKANTKTVVIGSLVVIIILFLLSVLVPIPSTTDTTTEENPTNASQTESTI